MLCSSCPLPRAVQLQAQIHKRVLQTARAQKPAAAQLLLWLAEKYLDDPNPITISDRALIKILDISRRSLPTAKADLRSAGLIHTDTNTPDGATRYLPTFIVQGVEVLGQILRQPEGPAREGGANFAPVEAGVGQILPQQAGQILHAGQILPQPEISQPVDFQQVNQVAQNSRRASSSSREIEEEESYTAPVSTQGKSTTGAEAAAAAAVNSPEIKTKIKLLDQQNQSMHGEIANFLIRQLSLKHVGDSPVLEPSAECVRFYAALGTPEELAQLCHYIVEMPTPKKGVDNAMYFISIGVKWLWKLQRLDDWLNIAREVLYPAPARKQPRRAAAPPQGRLAYASGGLA